jgi:hypothetical protein
MKTDEIAVMATINNKKDLDTYLKEMGRDK